MGPQHFDRHRPLKRFVESTIDPTHASLADLGVDAEVADAAAEQSHLGISAPRGSKLTICYGNDVLAEIISG